MLFETLLSPASSFINRGIDDNDQAQTLCDALEGKSLRVTAKPLPDPVLIAAAGGVIDVTVDDGRQVDAEISGTVIELNRLMFIDQHAPLREGHVEISGDIDIADRFRELLMCARPDLEANLADWFDPSTASSIASFARETRDWISDFAEDLAERTAVYLHEDSRQLPEAGEVEAHFAAVDAIVDDVERLEARINRLTEKPST